MLQIMKSAPDAQYMSISPQSAGGGIYTVSLNTLARSQQTSVLPAYAERAFHIDIPHDAAFESAKALMTCESVRQEVRLDTEDLRAMPQIKQIETVTIFVRNGDEITSLQRTSSYLTRSSLQYVDARGRPVDVRWYRVRYVPRERR